MPDENKEGDDGAVDINGDEDKQDTSENINDGKRFLGNSNDTSKSNKKVKKPFTFPWWCIYIAWMLTAACIGVSLFFLWAYGITFGNEKTTKWFTSLAISFVCSVFFTQPMKVC